VWVTSSNVKGQAPRSPRLGIDCASAVRIQFGAYPGASRRSGCQEARIRSLVLNISEKQKWMTQIQSHVQQNAARDYIDERLDRASHNQEQPELGK
jgi:hypothetical protein